MTRLFPALALSILALVACGQPGSSPAKSPTNDVTPPTSNTGDGKVMGADNVSPAEKLEQGPVLDSSAGVKPAAQPPAE